VPGVSAQESAAGLPTAIAPRDGVPASRRARSVLATTSAIHFVHDGFSDVIYLLLPVWATQFGLTYGQVGLLRTVYSGGMAAFQIPAGILAERWGETRLLAAGTAVTALGFLAAGLTGGFAALLACLVLGGLGSGVQHPLSSSLVSKAYETGPRRMALGTYNFAGDLGKVAVPAAVAFIMPWVGWRGAVEGYAAVGLLAAALLLMALMHLDVGHAAPAAPALAAAQGLAGWGIVHPRAYVALSAIHVIDNSTRSAFLTLLPFLLIAKGSTVRAVGLALMLVFAGGAAGKFACGALAERLGVIRTVVVTEAATCAGILLLLTLPLAGCLAVLPLVGIALNGTSSVLYGTVADLVASDRRARSYAIFYTVGVSASATAPFAYGLVSDGLGIPVTLGIIAVVVCLAIPLAVILRAPLAALSASART
jgi:MFS family permease